jgi:hypothetical protein
MTAVLAAHATNRSSSFESCRKMPLNVAVSRRIAWLAVCAARRARSDLAIVRVDTNKRVPRLCGATQRGTIKVLWMSEYGDIRS